jgi:hypothetical protein
VTRFITPPGKVIMQVSTVLTRIRRRADSICKWLRGKQFGEEGAVVRTRIEKEWVSRRVSRGSRGLLSYIRRPSLQGGGVERWHGAPVDEAGAGVGCRERERDGNAAGSHPRFLEQDMLYITGQGVPAPRLPRVRCRRLAALRQSGFVRSTTPGRLPQRRLYGSRGRMCVPRRGEAAASARVSWED